MRIGTRIQLRASTHICDYAVNALSLLTTLILAQDAPTIKVDVDVVNILFNVRDKKGGLIGNLEKGDFSIYEDGKQQEIKYFNRETDLPLTIGLLIDISASQGNLIEIEKDAASQFFGQVLRNKDLAFLISFGPDADLLAGLHQFSQTPARRARWPEASTRISAVFIPARCPPSIQPKGTVLYDADLPRRVRSTQRTGRTQGAGADHRRRRRGQPLQNQRCHRRRAEGRRHHLRFLLRRSRLLHGHTASFSAA